MSQSSKKSIIYNKEGGKEIMFRIVVIIGGQPLKGVWFDSKNWTIEEVQHLQENVLKNYSYYLEYKN